MAHEDIADPEAAKRAISVLNECFNVIFDRAPVMMHSIDTSGTLVRVNRRWTETLGYEADEVMGKKSVEFLTEESRDRAINNTLPLFWRAGHARSIGYRFVRKDDRVVDLLLDAEVYPFPNGNRRSYAVLYHGEDPVERTQASKTLLELRQLTSVWHRYEKVLSPEGTDTTESDRQAVERLPEHTLEPPASDVVAAFLELAQDTSMSLRAVARVQEELAGAMIEHQPELLLVLKSIDRTLSYLADALMTAPWMSD